MCTPLYVQRDLALGVPGIFTVVRCSACGLIYQNPRVASAALALCYPANYPPHLREPDLSLRLSRVDAGVRWVLARYLGYAHLGGARPGWRMRLRALCRFRRIRHDFPPFLGQGRLLDVGCATGRFLSRMAEVGWSPAGIEFDPEAAAKAARISQRVFVGDPTEAPFSPSSVDLITAFHVIEHLPDPLGALRRMVSWLAPEGRILVEVPNVAGLGGQLFGKYWVGLELPRHLTHFSSETMRAMVERAGGVIVRAQHKSKPRSFIRSLRHRLRDRAGWTSRLSLALLESRVGSGLLKLVLELLLPLAELAGRGEAVRYVIRRRDEALA